VQKEVALTALRTLVTLHLLHMTTMVAVADLHLEIVVITMMTEIGTIAIVHLGMIDMIEDILLMTEVMSAHLMIGLLMVNTAAAHTGNCWNPKRAIFYINALGIG